ncbi:NACHT domain-containing protein [Streptomyces sp. NPDC005303]|uniref:NACHT domain-containing protein n=1 Tax=Streptomyces sp. NPDC005303 TaxID=3155713 RepID=UPI0033A10A57
MIEDPMLQQAIGGVISNVVTATGIRLGVTLQGLGNRALAEDEEIVKWFNTYQITESRPQISDLPPGVTEEELCGILNSDGFHSVVHELLAARLTDATEEEVERIRSILRCTVSFFKPAIDLSDVSDSLFEYYDGEVSAIVGRLQGASKEFLPRLRGEAFSARMISSLRAIERRLDSFKVATPEEEREFVRRYRNHVLENFGKIEPPDFERRRRVPIDDLYVPPEITRVGSSPRDSVNTWQLAERIDRTVLLGDPGGGKTTASNVLMHWHAQSNDRRVPFLVTLREFASQDPPARSVVGHIENSLETFYQCPAPQGLVGKLLLSGSALVIFDGLDELIDTTRRADVTAIVERFGSEYPLARILVTSRLVGYNQARLDDQQFVRYRVGGFDTHRVGEYVRKWFAHEEGITRSEAEQLASTFMDESTAVSDLRSNPLMLALMCILYRGEGSIPQSRPEVYEQCANLLFRKWDARRRIHTELRARAHVEPALRHLAYWLFSRKETESAVTQRRLTAETAEFLHHRGFESKEEAREAADEFVNFCKGRAWVFSDAGTTAKGETLYTFTHRTFLEYFTAAYLTVVNDTPEKLAKVLAPRVTKQEWEVVAELSVQMKDRTVDQGAARIFQSLLKDRRYKSQQSRSNLLCFLASCLESVDPPPAVVRHLTGQILDHLFAGDVNDEICYAPTVLLTRCSGAFRDIVAREMNSKIASLLESEDSEVRVKALRLAVWCLPRLAHLNRGPLGGVGKETGNFWDGFVEENRERYAERIVSAAEWDPGFLFLAADRGLVNLDKILESSGGFRRLNERHGHPAGIFGIVWAPFLASRVTRMMWAEPEDISQIAQTMTSVGRYFLSHPDLPWGDSDESTWAEFVTKQSSDAVLELIPLHPDALLGASALLMIIVERSGNVGIRRGHPEDLRHLSPLYPYLAKRLNLEDVPLTSLPIRDDLQEVFRKWACGELHLTA